MHLRWGPTKHPVPQSTQRRDRLAEGKLGYVAVPGHGHSGPLAGLCDPKAGVDVGQENERILTMQAAKDPFEAVSSTRGRGAAGQPWLGTLAMATLVTVPLMIFAARPVRLIEVHLVPTF